MKTISILLLFVIPLMSYDFKVTVKWDELAMDGEAEGILQYYNQGRVEAIRGSLSKGSKDKNVTVLRTRSGGSQTFIIEKAKGRLINIWVANILMDEDFAEEKDFLTLANSKASVFIEDRINNQAYEVTIPPETPGLIFRAGAIVDGNFYDFIEMFKQQRIYNVTLINAVSGEFLEGTDVAIKDKHSGEIVAVGKTDANGYFAQKLDYGKYTAEFLKKGFIATGHEFEMDLTELPVSMNFGLSPHIKKFRIILNWGPYPTDLDAHLAGPKPEGGRFHIWWNQKTLISGKNFLDRDDTDRYGPETITIYKPASGEYHYAVHNYSGRNRSGQLDLSMSGARVDVYADGRLQKSFTVPQNQSGNVWKVFTIDANQNIVPVNLMSDESISSNILH